MSLTGRVDGASGKAGQPSYAVPLVFHSGEASRGQSSSARVGTRCGVAAANRLEPSNWQCLWSDKNVRGRNDSGEGSSSRNRRGGSASEAPPRAGQLLDQGPPRAL